MKRQMTLKQVTSKGGTATFKKYGSDHMAAIASRGRKGVLQKDPDYYKKLSASGVKARLAKKSQNSASLKSTSTP